MKRWIRILPLIAALFLLCACGQKATAPLPEEPKEPQTNATEAPAQEPEEEPTEPEEEIWENPQRNAYTLTKLRMIGRGEASEDYKLAFFEPETLDGVKAFVVCYSVEPFDTVWSYFETLTLEDVLALDKPVNRAYVITDLSYCDGVGNTLNTAQKDVVTGEEFTESGTHYFYAVTMGEDGPLSMEVAAGTAYISPTAGELNFTRAGKSITGSFCGTDGEELEKNYILVSHEGYAAVREKLVDRANLDRLAESGAALAFDNAPETAFTLDLSAIKTIDGKAPDEGQVLYLYVASAGAEEVIGLSYNDQLFVTPEMLPESSGQIGSGKGTIFPNGGAAKIGGGRGSVISTKQAIFDEFPDQPRIAVIGAASGSEKELWEYFYLDSSTKDSFLTRFTDAGFEPVYIPLTAQNRNTVGEDPYFAALVSSCHGVYFTGGDQSLGMYALTRDDGELNAVGEALQGLYERGGVLAGTSAGAHMLGEICFQDAGSLDSLVHPVPQTAELSIDGVTCGPEGVVYEGLPFSLDACGHSVVFDSHFGARGRLARLCVIQHATEAEFAVGLDEATGLAVSGQLGTVYGAGTVTILDSSEASYGEDSEKFSAAGLKLTILSAGDQYNFETRTIIPAASKTPADGSAEAELPAELLSATSDQARALVTFAGSAEESVTHNVLAGQEAFSFTFRKSPSFEAFSGKKTYAYQVLSDLPRTAATGILLDVQ